MPEKNVLIVGGGVAGLTAALELSHFDIGVDLIDRAPFLGGHGIQFACKAVDGCVKCGACMVEEKLRGAVRATPVRIHSSTTLEELERVGRFSATLRQAPRRIDPSKCTGCGICRDKCPETGAVVAGTSENHRPFYAIEPDRCRFVRDGACRICEENCPEGAIALDAGADIRRCTADAILLTTGFQPFSPEAKPYGYGRFENVVTNLELERRLRRQGPELTSPSGEPIRRIAFLQCVGSRDARQGHLWCSKVCCGSALRMARRIKGFRPDTAITFFYIDVQTFGKDFQPVYETARREIQMVRAIPADIFQTEDRRLKLTCLDPTTHESVEDVFDLVVLSIGMTPPPEAKALAERTGLPMTGEGFFTAAGPAGIFAAGSALGPMSIPEAMTSAASAASHILDFLQT